MSRPGRARAAIVVIAATLLLAVGIAAAMWAIHRGRGDSPGVDPQSAASVFDVVAVSGRVGATPVVALESPARVTALKSRVIATGAGRQITPDSPVLLAVTAFDGATGENLSPQGRPQLVVGAAGEADLGEDLAGLVIGQPEGTRLLVVRPIGGGDGPDAPAVEVDVVDVLATIAYGDEVIGEQIGALQVTMSPEGPVIRHGEEPPGGITIQTLVAGGGGQVREDDALVAQFAVVGWADGMVRSSTWTTGVPELIVLERAMPGLRQALVDQRIGSRLAITIPPDMADGDDTLCVVIDLLGVEPAHGGPADDDSPQSQGAAPQSTGGAGAASGP
ncbi:peptidylprolyl isomerase [Actinomyces sp. B33]|uniref:peptidylprolyl isomerase n=1 Tax=Actinomyces sp. B33 TaxID=2942131 RepID=UPI002340E889|nr:peptidylprolyl isomerase [Actinomyces sp. B33]MDC4233351.1 peptidylprolyl isomerase [Actinomyces sp. B33]